MSTVDIRVALLRGERMQLRASPQLKRPRKESGPVWLGIVRVSSHFAGIPRGVIHVLVLEPELLGHAVPRQARRGMVPGHRFPVAL